MISKIKHGGESYKNKTKNYKKDIFFTTFFYFDHIRQKIKNDHIPIYQKSLLVLCIRIQANLYRMLSRSGLGSASHRRRFPWLRFDFEKDYVIYEIELFVRFDCCGMYILAMQATKWYYVIHVWLTFFYSYTKAQMSLCHVKVI